jgi:glutamyl-tRNA reductase
MSKSSHFIEYMKLHLISINQDWEKARNNEPLNEYEHYESDAYYEGQIDAVEHLLSVATDIMNSSNERYN